MPTSEVTIPAVILALTISPSVASIVVIVAAVPTISVTAKPVIFVCLASSTSISTVVIVAYVPTVESTIRSSTRATPSM